MLMPSLRCRRRRCRKFNGRRCSGDQWIAKCSTTGQVAHDHRAARRLQEGLVRPDRCHSRWRWWQAPEDVLAGGAPRPRRPRSKGAADRRRCALACVVPMVLDRLRRQGASLSGFAPGKNAWGRARPARGSRHGICAQGPHRRHSRICELGSTTPAMMDAIAALVSADGQRAVPSNVGQILRLVRARCAVTYTLGGKADGSSGLEGTATMTRAARRTRRRFAS